MNPELPQNPREELELRLTALLLGELSETEAAAVREAIAKDPELTRLHDDLKQTIRLVRVVATRPEESAPTDAAQLKLSEERRQKLRTAFAIPPLKESDRKPKAVFRTRLIEVLVVLAIVALLAAVTMPNFVKSRSTAQSNAIINNLRQLDGAKQQWALEQGKSAEEIPTMKDLEPYVKGLSPVRGETYVLGKVGDSPSAEVKAGAERKLFRLPTSGAVLAGELGGHANLPDDGETLALSSGTSVERPLSSLTKSGKGTVTIDGLAVAPPATVAVAPQGQSSVDVHSLNVVGHVNLAGKDLNGQPTARVAGKGSQLYLPSKEAAVGDPEYVGVLGRTETTPQLGVPLQGGGRGGGGAGGVSHGHGEFAAKGVALGADFSGGDQLVSSPTQPEVTKSYGTLNLGASPAKPAPAPPPSASPSPRFYRVKPGAEGIASPSLVADGKKETDDSTWSVGYRRGELTDKENGTFAISQAYVAPPPPAATAGTLTINAGVVSDDFTTRTDGDTAKVPVLGDVSVLGRAFGNQPAGPATSDSGLLLYSEQAQSRQLNQLGTELAAVEPPQEHFYGVNAVGQERVAKSFDAKGGTQLGYGLALEKSDKRVNAGTAYYFDDGVKAGSAKAPATPAENFGEIVLPKPAGEVAKLAAVTRGTSSAVPERSLRETKTASAAQAGDATALVQDGRQQLGVGRLSEAEGRLKGALKVAPSNRVTGFDLARAETQRDREHEEKFWTVQREMENLRDENTISDFDASGLSPTFSAILARKIDSEARLIGREEMLKKLKGLSPEELREVLPKTVPDSSLTGLTSDLNGAERRLAELKKNHSATDPAVLRTQALVDDLKQKTDKSTSAFMAALETQVNSARAEVTKLEQTIEGAKKLDLAKAEQSRSYFDKKRELESLLSFRRILEQKIASEKIDVNLAKASADQLTTNDAKALEARYQEQERKIAKVQQEMARLEKESIVERNVDQADLPIRKPSTNAPIPQPEILTSENNFSTFSLNVSDVSFKLAAASLEKGQMPDPASVRTEEFINAFDYRDPEPAAGAPIAFAWERARYPFAHNRDLLRFSLRTAAAGRQVGRPLNIVLLLDNSGSMERADRVRIIREALRVLASQLQAQDKLSVITFSRTPRLFADGVSGDKAGEIVEQVGGLTPQGGTNLEDAMNLAYRTALRHYLANGINRVVLLTDGAANLGNVEPESLKQMVEAHRKQGLALDCFGVGWEGFNDDLLEVLSRNGDGRYGFINSPEEAATEFASQLAGALKVAASDVKVQVEFNPSRVTAYRQIGYAKHQLTKEQFRDNTVDAAEITAQEAGNALYTAEVNPTGEGPLCTVRARYKIPGTADYREQAWDVPFTGNAMSLEQSSPAMRLAASASAFAEWLVASPFAGEVTPDRLLGYLSGVPEIYGADARPKKLEWMIRQAKSLSGK